MCECGWVNLFPTWNILDWTAAMQILVSINYLSCFSLHVHNKAQLKKKFVLQRVDVDSIEDVSEVHAASIIDTEHP